MAPKEPLISIICPIMDFDRLGIYSRGCQLNPTLTKVSYLRIFEDVNQNMFG